MQAGTLNISGGVTFWRLGAANRELLAAGLAAVGMGDLLPRERTPKAILRDALTSHYADKKVLVRPLAKRAAFTVVDETRGESTNEYQTRFSVAVDEAGAITVDPSSPSTEQVLVDAYEAAKTVVPGATVTHVLVKACAMLGGIALRPSGGVYWLPSAHLVKWEKIVRMVEESAIKPGDSAVYLMRTANDPAALRAVRDGIITEITGQVLQIEQDIASGQLGERALQERVDQAKRLRTLLKEYEGILGEGLADIQAKIESTEIAASEAVLLAASKGAMPVGV